MGQHSICPWSVEGKQLCSHHFGNDLQVNHPQVTRVAQPADHQPHWGLMQDPMCSCTCSTDLLLKAVGLREWGGPAEHLRLPKAHRGWTGSTSPENHFSPLS